MAKRGQVFLDNDSDEDSINTTTTAPSEEDADQECGVEKILAEDVNKDTGAITYLLKWEGYPLHRCTWEPPENITSNILFRDWNKEKLAHKQGKVKPFDLTQYFEAVEQNEDEKDEKKRRRIAKRRKRGEVVQSASGEVSESQDDSHVLLQRVPKRKKARAPPPKRKGVALPVAKTRSEVISLDTDDESDGRSTSSDESIPAPQQTKAKPPTAASKIPAKSSETTAARSASKPTSENPSPENEPAAKPSKTAAAAEAFVPKPAPPPSTTAARKSVSNSTSKAPSQKPAPKSKVFSGDWTTDKKTSRQRVRVSGETRKDSTDPKFMNLSTQNRYQKYSKNEPTPDINAITIVDPKTGRAEPPKATEPPKKPTVSAQQGPADIHSAYGRRSRTPPPDSRARTPTPPTPAVQHPPLPTRAPVQPVIDTNQEHVSAPGLPTSASNSAVISTKDVMCRYWQAGHCQLTADKCPYAHAYRPNIVYSKRQTTCWYWKKNGSCKFGDDECQFAHYDTGIEAGRPGTFKKRTSSAPYLDTARPINLQSANGGSSPRDAAVFFDAPEQIQEPPQVPGYLAKESEDVFRKIVVGDSAVTDGEVTQPVTSPTGDASITNIHSSICGELQPTDKSMLTETTAISPAKDPRLRRQPNTESASLIDPQATEEVSLEMDRSIKADLEMTRQCITKLEWTRLLKDSGGQIENVYIHMPPDREGELHLLRRFFTKYHCKVYYQPNDVEHWAYFRDTFEKSSLLVFHPSETFIDTLPGLHKYLIEKGNKVRVFSIGVQHDQCIREMRESAYEARRLFPNGGITFITDDVFVYYPEKATEIIEAFLADAAPKPAGAHSTKIGARPGVKDWMARLAMKKFEEDGGEGQCTDMRWVQCYDALCRLCPIEDEDPDFPDHSVPLETSHLWSVWEESLPSFKGLWESGDEEGATDYMANHFAGEACDKAWQYRKFLFVYQRPGMEKEAMDSQGAKIVKSEVDPKGWMKKYCHIGVMTPEQALKSMKK